MAIHCPHCGTAAAPGDGFCADCGRPLGGQAPASQHPAPRVADPPPLTPALPWYRQTSGVIGLALGGAALAITAVVVFGGGSGEGAPALAPTAATQPTQPPLTSAPIVPTTAASTTIPTEAPAGTFSDATVAGFMDDCTALHEYAECSCVISESEETLAEADFNAAVDGQEISPETEAVLEAAIQLCMPDSGDGGSGQTGEPYSSEIRNGFLAECAAFAGTEFCSCALEELEQTYTEDEYIHLSTSGDAAAEAAVAEALLACSHLIDDPGTADPPIPPEALPYSCTNDLWSFTVNFPAEWIVHSPSDSADACRYYSQTGFGGLTEQQIADSAVAVWVQGDMEYDDVIDAVGDYSGLVSWQDVVIDERAGWLFEQDGENYGGIPVRFYTYVLPLWPDVPGSPPIILEAKAPHGSPLWDAAVAAVDAMAAAIEITPYSP